MNKPKWTAWFLIHETAIKTKTWSDIYADEWSLNGLYLADTDDVRGIVPYFKNHISKGLVSAKQYLDLIESDEYVVIRETPYDLRALRKPRALGVLRGLIKRARFE